MSAIRELYQLYLKHPKITKDTREDVTGGIYFALKGANFDGNAFAADALKKGAAYAVIDDLDQVNLKDARLIQVDNVLTTLQELAIYHRRKLDIPILAITGSNGKTTTKELVARVLDKKMKVYATPGNYNNHIGIPLSILQIRGDTEFIVLEMGASSIGEIANYCHIARPEYGIITNIGKAHLEGFGSEAGVVKGKGELFDYLAEHNGMAFVNSDEAHLDQMAQKVKRHYYYRQSDVPENNEKIFTADLVQSNPDILCKFCDEKGELLQLRSVLMGEHNFKNILTALAVGAWFKVPAEEMRDAIESYRPTNNRSQVFERDKVTYILDAYNANPSSMESMIRTFVKWNDGKKGLILGDMLELGKYSKEAHQAIVDIIRKMETVDFVYLVGHEFAKTETPPSFVKVDSVEELKNLWEPPEHENTTVLIKGSRSMKLETLL